MFNGISYKFYVTQPTKFDGDSKVLDANANANRIVGLTYIDEFGFAIYNIDLTTSVK